MKHLFKAELLRFRHWALATALVHVVALGFMTRVVDLRHWLLALAAVQVAACGYLAGAYAMLAGRRHSAAVLRTLPQ